MSKHAAIVGIWPKATDKSGSLACHGNGGKRMRPSATMSPKISPEITYRIGAC